MGQESKVPGSCTEDMIMSEWNDGGLREREEGKRGKWERPEESWLGNIRDSGV
jgi:hypothetical protein